MSWTTDDLTTIERAIAVGEKSVQFSDGRRIEYRSMNELQAARQMIAGALADDAAAVSGLKRRRFVRLFQRSRGY